jgi:hypothetical protein
MVVHFNKSWSLSALVASTALLVWANTPVQAQYKLFQGTQPGYCPPAPCPSPAVPQPAPTPPGTPPSPGTTPSTPPAPAPEEPSFPSEIGRATGTENVALAVPSIKGDQVPITSVAFAPPQGPGATASSRTGILAPSARTFKMSDDESPQPRDRVFVDFNYYDNVGAAVDRRLGIDLRNIDIYRETFGLEKTFLNNAASIGLRLPLDTLSADSNTPGLGGTDTDVGDITAILKYAFWQDPRAGILFSTGLAVTAPTGPAHFANSIIPVAHDTLLQPYVGYIWTADHWFMHGFSGIEVPTVSRDVTLLYNSIGVGYNFSRTCAQDRLVRAIVPTFEVHVSDPLNHRGAFKVSDVAGTADVVNLTMATTIELGCRSNLSVGIVTPVTGPKPFDVEALVQFNWFFGARGRRAMASSTNVIGE